ncbi:MAG: patatin-like phospholipase family protein [Xanthobacteraceae bacterium]
MRDAEIAVPGGMHVPVPISAFRTDRTAASKKRRQIRREARFGSIRGHAGLPVRQESVMPKMGLILQGGGALGAYEYGAVQRLIELGWQPVAVSGVSIGATTAAVIAGARGGDIGASLKRLWDAITLKPIPFWPAERQATFSMFGNPAFWRTRNDYFNIHQWTSLCDVSPMRDTLATICDFERLNDASRMRVAVTATNVMTGDQVTFSNHVPNSDTANFVTPKSTRTTLTPDHILASGSLPPAFPMTFIDGIAYWDGGLFDNTPVESLLEMLDETEIEHLPLFVVDLFATHAALPTNLAEVNERMTEISYESRFLVHHADADGSLAPFTSMLEAIERDLPRDSSVRATEPFHQLFRLRALKNLRVIQADHAPMSGCMDFSVHGVESRHKRGYEAVDKFFAQQNVDRPPVASEVASTRRRETKAMRN